VKARTSDVYALKKSRKLTNGDARHPEIEATSSRARLQFPVESLAHLSREDAGTLQRLLHHGETFGVWTTRTDWAPPGSRNAVVTVDIRQRIFWYLPKDLKEDSANVTLTQLANAALLTLVRYLVLLRMGPSGQGRDSFRALGPTSIRAVAYTQGPALLAIAVTKRIASLNSTRMRIPSEQNPADAEKLLSDLTQDDLTELTPAQRHMLVKECRRMEMLGALGLWDDVPQLEKRSLASAMVGPALKNPAPPARDPHRPLPDEYVAEMGARGLWLIQDLAPNLFRIGETFLEIWADHKANWMPVTIRDRRREAVREFLADYQWVDASGNPITKPPFSLRLPKPKGFGAELAETEHSDQRWPPRSHLDYMGLVGAVQAAHLFVAFLSMGARRSEILSLKRDCVVYAEDGRAYAKGRTFKLVERHEGEERDWLLPDMAVIALEQQARLVVLGEQLGYLTPRGKSDEHPGAHLWGQLSAAGASEPAMPLDNVNKALLSYARTLNMDIEPGGQPLRSHRFRKTLARLVALALTQAPRLLMDVFGHRSIEMTMYYILTDKDLRAEIEVVSRELRVMRAKEVVEKMVEADTAGITAGVAEYGGYGGPAAVSIHHAIETHREQLHRRGTDWGLETSRELAELLTLQGKAWELVRPGVMCTKFAGEAGPCNKSKGRPEPSKCLSHCSHRLEETFLHEDVDGTISEVVEAYEQALANNETLTAAHWAAQVRAHVPRFADLHDKWIANPTVAALMNNNGVA
jgi:integrase